MRRDRIRNKIVTKDAEVQTLLQKMTTVVWPSQMNRQKTDIRTDIQTETYKIVRYGKIHNIQPGTGKHQTQRKEMARKENKRLWEDRRLDNFQPYKPYQIKMILAAPTCQTALLPPLQ